MKLKKIISLLVGTLCFASLCSCDKKAEENSETNGKRDIKNIEITDDKYRNYYEIFVRYFNDTNGDGIVEITCLSCPWYKGKNA